MSQPAQSSDRRRETCHRDIGLALVYFGFVLGLSRGLPDTLSQAPFGDLLVLVTPAATDAMLAWVVWHAVGVFLKPLSARGGVTVAAVVWVHAVLRDPSLAVGIVGMPIAALIGAAAELYLRDRARRGASASLRRIAGILAGIATMVAVVAFWRPFFDLAVPARIAYVVACLLAAFGVLRGPRPGFAALGLLLVASAAWPYPAPPNNAADPDRPDILLITIDTLRPDHLGLYGYARDTSPNLDLLAKHSVVFEQAVTSTPITNPAHSSLFTGVYAGRHGATNNGVLMGDDYPTIAGKLNALGYDTAAFTSAVVLDRSASNLHREFRYVDDLHPGWKALPNHALDVFEFRIFKAFSDERVTSYERSAAWTSRAALDWLETRKGPVFLWVHYFDPHGGYLPPEPFASRWAGDYDGPFRGVDYYFVDSPTRRRIVTSPDTVAYFISQYDGEIAYTDHWAGRLIDAMEARRDTIVAVTSDHGESLGEHDYWFDHGNALYDASLRIPLLIKMPGKRGAGRRIDEQVRLIDVYPTLMQLLGRPVVEEIDGRSLLPLIDGDVDEPRDLYARVFRPSIKGGKAVKGERTADGMKIVHVSSYWSDYMLESAHNEVFDLRSDPGETVNLANPNDPELRERVQRMLEWHERVTPATRVDAELTGAAMEQLRSLGYVN